MVHSRVRMPTKPTLRVIMVEKHQTNSVNNGWDPASHTKNVMLVADVLAFPSSY